MPTRYKPPKEGSAYYMPEQEFHTVVNFCQCYDGWKMRLRVIDETLHQLERARATVSAIQVDGMPHGTETGDPTGNEATRAVSAYNDLQLERARVLVKIEIIETIVLKECGEVLYPYVLRGITKREPYYMLYADGMPLTEKEYGKMRRRVYFQIARVI